MAGDCIVPSSSGDSSSGDGSSGCSDASSSSSGTTSVDPSTTSASAEDFQGDTDSTSLSERITSSPLYLGLCIGLATLFVAVIIAALFCAWRVHQAAQRIAKLEERIRADHAGPEIGLTNNPVLAGSWQRL